MSEKTPPTMFPTEPDAERLRQEALDWLRRLTSGEMTETELRDLDRWRDKSAMHRSAFAEANLLWDTLEPVARQGRANDVVARARSQSAKWRFDRRAMLGGGAVAALAAATYVVVRPPLQLWPGLNELTAEHRTSIGEQRALPTPPGIDIEMNTRTSLSALREDGAVTRLDLISGRLLSP